MKLHTIGITLLLSSGHTIYCAHGPTQAKPAKSATAADKQFASPLNSPKTKATEPSSHPLSERLAGLEKSAALIIANQQQIYNQMAANQQELIANQGQIYQLLLAVSRKQNSIEADIDRRFNQQHQLLTKILGTQERQQPLYAYSQYPQQQPQYAYYVAHAAAGTNSPHITTPLQAFPIASITSAPDATQAQTAAQVKQADSNKNI